MATAQDLLDLLNIKLLGYKDALPGGDTDKIGALNAGWHKVWQAIVGASKPNRSNWFAKSSTVNFTSAKTANLPVDFHDLLSAESTTVLMKSAQWHKAGWQDDRALSASVDPATLKVLYYTVEGSFETPQLLLSRLVSSLTVTIHYTATLPNLTAAGDLIDAMPPPYRDAITNYAMTALVSAMHDPEVYTYWDGLWKADREMIAAAAAERLTADMISPEGFDSAG